MFNIQKFINVFEAGYFIFDIAITSIANKGLKFDNLQIQLFFHHFVSIFGICVGLYMDHFFGSISQLTMITELSTISLNIRAIMVYHKQQGSLLYIFNGFIMTISFYFIRILWYHFIIFGLFIDFGIYYGEQFWASIYPEPAKVRVIYISYFVYFLLYCLQLFWFSKILAGLLKAFGVEAYLDKQINDEENSEKKNN